MLVCTGAAQTDLCRQILITNLDPYGVMRGESVAARLMQGIDHLIESVTQGFKTIRLNLPLPNRCLPGACPGGPQLIQHLNQIRLAAMKSQIELTQPDIT